VSRRGDTECFWALDAACNLDLKAKVLLKSLSPQLLPVR
jgi:hypothetical protein